MLMMVSEFRFIPPCRPVPAKAVPGGDGWVHELKFDGYGVQGPQDGLAHRSVRPQ
jgi:ATP-dependent DNA ligase